MKRSFFLTCITLLLLLGACNKIQYTDTIKRPRIPLNFKEMSSWFALDSAGLMQATGQYERDAIMIDVEDLDNPIPTDGGMTYRMYTRKMPYLPATHMFYLMTDGQKKANTIIGYLYGDIDPRYNYLSALIEHVFAPVAPNGKILYSDDEVGKNNWKEVTIHNAIELAQQFYEREDVRSLEWDRRSSLQSPYFFNLQVRDAQGYTYEYNMRYTLFLQLTGEVTVRVLASFTILK